MEFQGVKCEDALFLDAGDGQYKILHTNTDDGAEVIIKYTSNQPFNIQEICIFLTYSFLFQRKMYCVWKCEYYANDDIECIAISKKFAEEISKYLKSVLDYFINTEGLLSKKTTL